jgi:hypothetical protein
MSNPNPDMMREALNNEILPELEALRRNWMVVKDRKISDLDSITIYHDMLEQNELLIRMAYLMNDIITLIQKS